MKRVRCPKCDNYIVFDETRYQPGQQLVFVCPECNKQFGIRMGTAQVKTTRKEADAAPEEPSGALGSIVVVENVFHYRQVTPVLTPSIASYVYSATSVVNCSIYFVMRPATRAHSI